MLKTSPGCIIDAFDCIPIHGFTGWHEKKPTQHVQSILEAVDDFKQKDRSTNHHEEGVGSEDKTLETASFVFGLSTFPVVTI